MVFWGVTLHENVLINIEELLGVFFTTEALLEFTGGSHSPAGDTIVGFSFRWYVGDGAASGGELAVHKHRIRLFIYSVESVEILDPSDVQSQFKEK